MVICHSKSPGYIQEDVSGELKCKESTSTSVSHKQVKSYSARLDYSFPLQSRSMRVKSGKPNEPFSKKMDADKQGQAAK